MYEKIRNNCSMSIAGLDPSGGAGILADCKTFHAHNIYATCVITAITSQNPFTVTDIQEIDNKLISEEIDTILDVYPIEYIKTGMLFTNDIIKLVSKKIDEYNLKAVVDPVMISESGKNLTKNDYVCSLKKYLLKKAYILTPNIDEASKISGTEIHNEEDMKNVAEYLSNDNSIVITGGHMKANDILFHDDKIHIIEGEWINSNNTHGTGCTYSSSLTSNLIKGHDIKKSCQKSKEFMYNSIKNGYNLTPNQFYNLK